jgi:hypothetical protein
MERRKLRWMVVEVLHKGNDQGGVTGVGEVHSKGQKHGERISTQSEEEKNGKGLGYRRVSGQERQKA